MPNLQQLEQLLAPWGELRPQAASDWRGSRPLPEELTRLYEQIGPWGQVFHASVGPVGSTLAVGGNPVCIPPLHKLFDLQAGYAWRSSPAEPLPGWPEHWLVIAEQGGDPFILDTLGGQVLFAFHGAGRWEPRPFAPDLLTAIGALATVANTHEALSEQELDPDDGLTPRGRARIMAELGRFLGSEQQAGLMLAAWEYYE